MRQLVGGIEAEPEGGIDRAALARAAEKAPDRLAERLSLDVPQRHIDGGDGMHADPALPARHQRPVEPVPDPVIVKRVHADDGGRGDVKDGRADRRRRPDGGDAVAGDPGVGLDLDHTGLVAGLFRRRGDVEGDRQLHRMRADGGDLHQAALSQWLTISQAMSNAARVAPTSAVPVPAMSKAVPCAGVVTGNGMPP